MGMIRVLDDATINQIAAGEVVERPASVVKELIENAIDAGSTRISISVREGGKSYIQIRDNGHGMTREDAILSFEKHSTSKIREINDIYNVLSLGFRGEALASIASVSQTTMVTRTAPKTLEAAADQHAGTRIVLDGGEMKSVEEIGCPLGTTITVENLFFNVPARLKYLKSDRTELNHILAIVTSRTLAYPEVQFELTHDGRRLIFTPGSGNRLETISSILGKTAARDMVELSFSHHRARVSGFISRPSYTRANHQHIHLFINRRPIRSPHIVRAIREGFGTLLPPVRFPAGVVDLTIDPKELDVNVHPAKTEVKFQYPEDVYSCVVKAVTRALRGRDLSVRTELGERSPGRTISHQERPGSPGRVAEAAEQYDPSGPHAVEPATVPDPSHNPPHTPSIRLVTATQDRIDGIDPTTIPKTTSASISPVPTMKPIGQIANLFIIVETEDGLAIIDQHAAHERVMYERLKTAHAQAGETVKHQRLIEPISLELAPEEKGAVERYHEFLEFLGFGIEEFGGNTYLVRTVPIVLGKHVTPKMVYDIIDELVATGSSTNLDERKDDMLKLLACHTAIRGGEELTMPKIEKLLGELLTIENPFTCPHGRPTILRLSTAELEKKFKRTGF